MTSNESKTAELVHKALEALKLKIEEICDDHSHFCLVFPESEDEVAVMLGTVDASCSMTWNTVMCDTLPELEKRLAKHMFSFSFNECGLAASDIKIISFFWQDESKCKHEIVNPFIDCRSIEEVEILADMMLGV